MNTKNHPMWVEAAFRLSGPRSPFTWERQEYKTFTKLFHPLDLTMAVAINDLVPSFEVTGAEDSEGRWVVLRQYTDGRLEGEIDEWRPSDAV